MNKIYTPILFTLVSFLWFSQSYAQSVKRYKKTADQYYADNNYGAAISIYEAILDDENSPVGDFYVAATSARKYKAYELAEQYYHKVADSEDRSLYKETDYWLAMMKKNQANADITKYDEAIDLFTKFASEQENTEDEELKKLVAKAKEEVSTCEWAKGLMENPRENNLENYGSAINTCQSEFGSTVHDDKIYYSTFPNNEKTNEPGFYSKIYTRSVEGEDIGHELGDDFNFDKKHAAHLSFNEDGSRVYFTICEGAPIAGVNCKIYYRDKTETGWDSSIELPGEINQAGYTSTHPSVGKDESGRDVLYFASNRISSYGDRKMDIWQAVISSSGEVTDLKNLDFINTEEDDMTPYYHFDTKTLYFSSDGHISMGGFDIYKIRRKTTGWSRVNHLGYPINSSYDDLYMTLTQKGDMGYYTSNRNGGTTCSSDEDIEEQKASALTCVSCNDIYKVEVPLLQLNVLTYNKITGEPLHGVNVQLRERSTSNVDDQADGAGNEYDYVVNFDDNYNVNGSLEGYESDMENFETFNENGDTVIVKKLYLTPSVILVVNTYDDFTGEPLAGVKVDLLRIQNNTSTIDNTGNDGAATSHAFPLDFRYDYKIEGSKIAWEFTRGDTEASTLTIEAKPDTIFKDIYFCKTGNTINDDLLSVYFDNDIPKAQSSKNLNYTTVYNNYLTKRGYFINRAAANDKTNLDAFFDDKVVQGYKDLENFATSLIDFFDSAEPHETVEVEIQGYASKLGDDIPNYNNKLTERRIRSLRNYFKNFSTSADYGTTRRLANYYNRIKVSVSPKGSRQALCGDCGVRGNTQRSVYSTDASTDRRVVIVQVNYLENNCKPNSYTPQPPTYGEAKKPVYVEQEKAINSYTTTIPKVDLNTLTFDKKTGHSLSGVNVVLYEVLGNSNRRLNSGHSLEQAINNFDLDFNRKYMVVASKDGYVSDTVYFNTNDLAQQTITLSENLYLCKFLTRENGTFLYFDNDEPDKDNMRTTTRKSYKEAYDVYLNRQAAFAAQCEDNSTEQAAINQFFEVDVISGYQNLERFANDMLSYFQNADGKASATILIRGFASRRSSSAYNKALTKRRVSSVENYFATCLDGNLNKYMNRISIEEQAQGDSNADCIDCDDIKNERKSIYSLEASKDRKVEIVRVKFSTSECDTY